MLGLPLAFAYPWVLLGLLALPIIWYLLRLTPPKPQSEIFPPLVILERLANRDETPSKSPWWLTLLRLTMAALVILAMAGPVWNPRDALLRAGDNLLIVMDDGWASSGHWEEAKASALKALGEAAESSRLVSLLQTSDPASATPTPIAADAIRPTIEAAANRPQKPDHLASAAKLEEMQANGNFGEILFLTDGLSRSAATNTLINAITRTGLPVRAFEPDIAGLAIIGAVENEPGRMTGTLVRADNSNALPLRVTGRDKDGLAIARAPVLIAAGETQGSFNFEQPVELRNQIMSVSIDEAGHAGAVQLLDESNRRRIVGLISGQSADIAQPLLSPLYYINRALSPFSDIRDANTANLELAVEELLAQNVSAIVMADVGTLPPQTLDRVSEFVEGGGLLIRFAGPRLAANPDTPLLPVELVQGDRFIGGALSWETPKEIAAFEPGSPFFGMEKPQDVAISRQVLAVQSRSLEERTWARLADGTPLVTAGRQGEGWIVLFHVNSDNNWSNLPLSGTFVEMLRRTVNLSRSTAPGQDAGEGQRLPAFLVLDGKGNLVSPPSEVKPLVMEAGNTPAVSLDNPPGLYGTEDGYVALNLMNGDDRLEPINLASNMPTAETTAYVSGGDALIKPWLLVAAALLFLLDCLAVLWFAGVLKTSRRARAIPASLATVFVLGFAMAIALPATNALAQQAGGGQAGDSTGEAIDFSAALKTRFAYVRTGDAEIDRISEAGLLGLTRYVASRTALEPGDPIGVDISSDELAFFPFLYWPIADSVETPDAETMSRVDAYMKQGGSILFDTRDQINSSLSGGGNPKLMEILATLDIPPLEPVPPDHVLTKSFYLLDSFPGRYQGGELWVEQIAAREEASERPARAGDGVSTLLITSNDFAGAWAIDEENRSLFPTIPPNPAQREFAFRAGVNIVMYSLTGNYKADQVHIPALLERLGQ